MGSNVVDRLHQEFEELLAILKKAEELSLLSTADDTFRKSLLLSAASCFEHRLSQAVEGFVRHISRSNPLVTSFVKNKAISRQYHTWFDWEKNNANKFYGLFGDEFLTYMKARIREDQELEKSVQAFLELGRDRNRLVHQDYGNFTLEKTSAEIYELYSRAVVFVDCMPLLLREFPEPSD